MCFEGSNCKKIIIIIASIAVILGILDLTLLKINSQYDIKPSDISNLPKDDDDSGEKTITNVDQVIDDYVKKLKDDDNADWKGGSGTLKENVSEILRENHYGPIADSVNVNGFNSLSDLAKIDANNVLDDERNSKNKYETIEGYVDADAQNLIDQDKQSKVNDPKV